VPRRQIFITDGKLVFLLSFTVEADPTCGTGSIRGELHEINPDEEYAADGVDPSGVKYGVTIYYDQPENTYEAIIDIYCPNGGNLSCVANGTTTPGPNWKEITVNFLSCNQPATAVLQTFSQ